MAAMVIAEETLSLPNDSLSPPSPISNMESWANKRKHADQKGVTWYMKAPIRGLRRMRDSYEKGMTRCAATRGTGYLSGSAGGVPTKMNYAVRNHAAWANASEEDIRELMRAASLGLLRAANPAVPRTQSAGPTVGRIDENSEMEFDDDINGGGGLGLGGQGQNYTRSKSYAVVLPSRNRKVPTSPARKV